jgi:hypothetical protein
MGISGLKSDSELHISKAMIMLASIVQVISKVSRLTDLILCVDYLILFFGLWQQCGA